jgi:hypothetical protein
MLGRGKQRWGIFGREDTDGVGIERQGHGGASPGSGVLDGGSNDCLVASMHPIEYANRDPESAPD